MSDLKFTDNLYKRIKQGASFVLVGTMLLTTSAVIKNSESDRNNGRFHELYQTATSQTQEIEVSQGVNIYVDGLPFTPTNAKGELIYPFVYNGTTYLPVRALANSFGIAIDWDDSKKAVTMSLKSIQINNNTKNREQTPLTSTKIMATTGVKFFVDNKETMLTDTNGNIVEPLVVDGTTYLPVRAISNLFQVGICWNQQINNDSIYSNVYIGKIYHNVNQETNNTMMECANQVDKVRPYLEPISVRQLRMLDLFAYAINISSDICKLCDEVESNELNAIYQRVLEHKNMIEELNIKTQSMATLAMADHIKYSIFNYPNDLQDMHLDFNHTGILTHYAKMMQDTVNDYQEILVKTQPEELQKHYDEINAIYNEAINIYNGLVPTRTLQYK